MIVLAFCNLNKQTNNKDNSKNPLFVWKLPEVDIGKYELASISFIN